MRLLLLTETVPYPLDAGGRIKTFHTLQALSAEHEVHCHAFVRTDAQRDATMEPLGHICRSVTLHRVSRSLTREAWYFARSLVTRVPYTVCRHYEPAVMARVADACRVHRIEAVYCDHLSMFEYAKRLNLPIVHDAHNVEHRIVRRHAASLSAIDPRKLVLAREWRRLRAYESAMYARSRLIFAVSDVDATEISALAGGGVPVMAVPIAVDARHATPVRPLTDRPQALFVGALDWPPNAEAIEWFLRDVWPRVVTRRPEATFVVVGRGEATLARRWHETPGVQFTGRVPDVTPWFAASRVHVVPLRAGSGMRVKILDAFARGVPVVTTTIGVEGIDVRPGEHALVADTADDLADAVLRVFDDRRLAEALADNAHRLVLERYDVTTITHRQLEALRSVPLVAPTAP
jgi:polysaccharide biosynthesis protein PslH